MRVRRDAYHFVRVFHSNEELSDTEGRDAGLHGTVQGSRGAAPHVQEDADALVARTTLDRREAFEMLRAPGRLREVQSVLVEGDPAGGNA